MIPATGKSTDTPRFTASLRTFSIAGGEKSKAVTAMPCSANQTELRPPAIGDAEGWLTVGAKDIAAAPFGGTFKRFVGLPTAP